MATIDDVNSTLQGIAQQLGLWTQAYSSRLTGGVVTLSNATVTVVANGAVKGTSVIIPEPANFTAGLIRLTNGLYVTAQTAGVGFTLSTVAGSATTGGIFSYIVFNPT